jgi:mannosylglycoprotein endo-beta-mannosidase
VPAGLRAGARRKSPGIDGLFLEFYTANWETVRSELLLLLNHMFLYKHTSRRQKLGIIVCLPKSTSPPTLEDYRPISFLTTEYKLLVRIYARRLRHILVDQLQNNHFCSVPGNSIQAAISCTRYVLAHAEATGTPMCVLK